MPSASAPAGPSAEGLYVSRALPPRVQKTPSPDPELAADPDYQEGLRRSEAARLRRADKARVSKARKQNQGSGPADPILAPKNGGVTKRGKKRGPNKYWECSRYDPPSAFPYLFSRFVYLFIFVFHYPCSFVLTLLR